jgi:benzoyl-CoA reductase/2-hydroxyglutaryl-CoA dehydratase subunit BcrC/BadD/HgdB
MVYRLTYPVTRYATDDSAEIYFRKELELLSKNIESSLDRPFLKDNYERAVSMVGEFRLDVQFLYAARLVDPEVISYTELVRLVRSFLSAPVTAIASEVHDVANDIKVKLKEKKNLELANSVLAALQTKDFSKIKSLERPSGLRVMVIGGMIEPQAISTVINSIEDYSDTNLVLDHLSFGFKSVFTPPIDPTGDPYEQMAKSILAAPGEPTQEGLQYRMQFLKAIVESLYIDGLIICEQSFCDPDQFEAPSIEKAATAAGIRTVRIPIDPELSDRARIEVKLQTFFESIGK